MKRSLLILAILGTLLPNIFVIRESIQSANYMFYTRPLETFQLMFANNVSSAFGIDLLFVVMLFLIWTIILSKSIKIKYLWFTWLFTFLMGLAGAIPLFLYLNFETLEKSIRGYTKN